MSLPIVAAVVPLRLQLNRHPILSAWFHRATGCLLLKVSTYLSSRIDSSSAFVSPPAKPEFLWVTQCFLPLHEQLCMPNQFRTWNTVSYYKHWQMFHPASHPREACLCSSVPVESYATFQVEGRYFMKWTLSPGRSTSLLQRICYNLT